MFNDYALIIGVEDYSAYDRSMDLPAGTSTAIGAVNDARTLYRQCLSMGFSPERVRVLTSPKLAPRDLGPEATEATVGEATHDAIVAGLTDLAQNLSQPAPAAGLLTFSGHGLTSNGVALCPSDLTGSMDQLIHVASIRARFEGKVGDNLTMLLDCCRGQNNIANDAAESLRAHLTARSVTLKKHDAEERMIASCKAGQVSLASRFGGVKMGAFTWAITSAMGQWATTVEKGVARLDVSYGELTSRATALLRALSFDQDPELTGPKNVEALPFLHPGNTVHWGETSREPDGLRTKWQLDGGHKAYQQYMIKVIDVLGVHHVMAKIAVTNQTGYLLTSMGSFSVTAGNEYWFVDTAVVQQYLSQANNSLLVQGEGEWEFSRRMGVGTCTTREACPASATWTAASRNWPAGAQCFITTSGGPPTAMAIIPTSGNALQTVYWYQAGTTNIAPGTVDLDRPGASDYPSGYVAPSTLTLL